ncbi:hypothetical protein Nepgr_032288 [Nepenthes gracilis]|uniref:Uncharacterized protein n=1 Tax=Nepenthes gracilis TaxID=150966 RepID=A0AAD3TJ03_NEPGR|nr:hypothetical protein Nepgr_032288 [Nepenthes gracilis]
MNPYIPPTDCIDPVRSASHGDGMASIDQSSSEKTVLLSLSRPALEPMQSQLGIVGAPESPFQPESKLNPVDDVDLDRTPSSIKRICKKYGLEHLTSSAEVYSLEAGCWKQHDPLRKNDVEKMKLLCDVKVPMDDIAKGEFCCRAACDDN